jgi:hypothetical protein
MKKRRIIRSLDRSSYPPRRRRSPRATGRTDLRWIVPRDVRFDISVLLQFDLIYRTRFWTSFECWLSFMLATSRGIVSAPHGQTRCETDCMPGTPEPYALALRSEWADCNALAAFEKLKDPKVTVTNKSDKEMQLPKILALDETVKALMAGRGISW